MRCFIFMKNDAYFMKLALKEAKKAYKNNDVPVGSILVDENNNIVARGYNKKEYKKDLTLHAEVVAIKNASKKLNTFNLDNLTLYVTLMPCLMCEGLIINSKIKRLVFGTKDTDLNENSYQLMMDEYFNNNVEIKSNVLEEECREILTEFFKNLRKK